MLTDNQNRIAREALAAAAESFRNGGIHAEAELFRAFLAQVTFRLLVDVQRNDFDVRLMPFAAVWISNQKSIADVLPMREVPVNGGNDRDSQRLLGCLSRGSGNQSCGTEKFTASQHLCSPES